MKSYFEGREKLKINEVDSPLSIENKYFVNERNDKLKLESKKIENSTFATMGFKSATIISCQFMYCIFINCYFKDAKFDSVKFIGCKFIDCNFEGTSYANCDFRYANFKNCFVHYDALSHSIPIEENLRWRLCKNLARECLSLGFTEEYRKYYFEEKKATEQQYIEILLRRQPYYKNKYGGWDALIGLFKLILSKLNKLLWGYGENLKNLLINIIITISVFTFFYYKSGEIFKVNGDSSIKSLNLSESLYLSVSNFITVSSDITTADALGRNLVVIEGVLGVTLMGFFIAALFRYVNRR